MRDITIHFQARVVECCFLAQVGMRSLIREHRKVFGSLQESINGARISERWQKDVMSTIADDDTSAARTAADDSPLLSAQWGDTLLFELSYQHNKGNWPRQMTNDQGGGVFKDKFPYLLDPQPEKAQAPPPGLSMVSIWKLIGIAVGLVVALILENWLVAIWYCRRKRRKVLL